MNVKLSNVSKADIHGMMYIAIPFLLAGSIELMLNSKLLLGAVGVLITAAIQIYHTAFMY